MYTTAKRILERRGIQTSSSFVKLWLLCILEFKANFLLFWHLYGLFFLSRIYWRLLDYDLLASIWEAISILTGNLNLGRSYLITAVPGRKNINKRVKYRRKFVKKVIKNIIFVKKDWKHRDFNEEIYVNDSITDKWTHTLW